MAVITPVIKTRKKISAQCQHNVRAVRLAVQRIELNLFRLKIGIPITTAVENVYTNFGFGTFFFLDLHCSGQYGKKDRRWYTDGRVIPVLRLIIGNRTIIAASNVYMRVKAPTELRSVAL